jgi:hypothetical protein
VTPCVTHSCSAQVSPSESSAAVAAAAISELKRNSGSERKLARSQFDAEVEAAWEEAAKAKQTAFDPSTISPSVRDKLACMYAGPHYPRTDLRLYPNAGNGVPITSQGAAPGDAPAPQAQAPYRALAQRRPQVQMLQTVSLSMTVSWWAKPQSRAE